MVIFHSYVNVYQRVSVVCFVGNLEGIQIHAVDFLLTANKVGFECQIYRFRRTWGFNQNHGNLTSKDLSNNRVWYKGHNLVLKTSDLSINNNKHGDRIYGHAEICCFRLAKQTFFLLLVSLGPYLDGGIHNLPFFRASSKHVAGSISSGVCFDSHLGLFQRYHI